MKRGKFHVRNDPLEAVKDRADFALLSQLG
jgi:hypothetical protein